MIKNVVFDFGQVMVHFDPAYMVGLSVTDKEDAALRFLDEKFKKVKNGKGIAFTVPMTSVIGVAIYQFLSNNGG